MTPIFKKLRHFQSVEFDHPEELQSAFLLPLGSARVACDAEDDVCNISDVIEGKQEG